MTELSSRQILSAIDDGLEEAGRWPQLLRALGFDIDAGRPGPVLINNAMQKRGFRRVLDEKESIRLAIESRYPDEWWFAIAGETARRPDAKVADVVGELKKRAPQFA
jgi:hypothetical protein